MVRSTRLLAFAALVALVACGKDNPAAPPVVSTVVVTPGADTIVTLGRTRQFTAVARDGSGNPVNGVTLVWHSSNPSVATVDSVTGTVTALSNGLSIIRANASGVTGQATLAVAQAVATVVLTPASRSFAVVGDTQRFAALAKDSGGATVQGVRFLWVSSNGNAATVDTSGLATSRGAGQATISATGRGIPGYAAVAVTQTATQLSFSVQPSTVVAGDAFSPAVQVEIRDAAGALVAGARDAITLGISTNPGSGTLAGSRTVNAVGGVATFSGVWIDKVGVNYRLSAAANGIAATPSGTFTVTPAAAARIAFVHSPGTELGNTIFPDTVEVDLYDRFGNLAVGSADTVTVSIARDPWASIGPAGQVAIGATLSGIPSVAPTAGRALFTNLVMDKPGAGYALRAALSSPAVPTVTGGVFAVHIAFADPVSAGFDQSCSQTSAGFYCWGGDSVPEPLPGSIPLVQMSMGFVHSCGLTAAGIAYCWGDNQYGEMGSALTFSQVPVPVQGGHTFTAIDAGDFHTCGVAVGGQAYCWGYGANGERGDSSLTTAQFVPTLVTGGLTFRGITAGGTLSCGVTTDSLAYCWGSADGGQLGNGVTAGIFHHPVPVGGGLKFVDVQAGVGFACGITSTQAVYCWGSNAFYQLAMSPGSGLTQDSLPWPSSVPASTAIAIGQHHGCAFGAGGILRCWGRNLEGQVGDGTTDNRFSASFGVLGLVTSVAAGATHTCARSNGVVYCWGANDFGQLGDGTKTDALTPRLVLLQQ